MAESSDLRQRSAWQVFRQDLANLRTWLRGGATRLLNWLFDFTNRGALRRRMIFVAFTLIGWLFLAFFIHPIDFSQGDIGDQMVAAIFSVVVIRTILILAFGLWLALLLASIYLDDLFELDNISMARQFLWQAAFAGHYKKIVIKDGGIAPEFKDSPVYQIGGPGLVDVHLENAALFERINGTPNVIAPTDRRPIVIEGFERLRDVVDLRDQKVELSVLGRTQDGIRVWAKDVQAVFSIYRGRQHPVTEGTLQQPYSFTIQAVLNLVYKLGRDPLKRAINKMVRSEIGSFISRHTLDEFLAYAGDDPKANGFTPRDQLTQQVYEQAQKKVTDLGIELQWIGVGTWVTPNEIIPERHLEAWKLSSDTRLHRSKQELERIRKESRFAELLRIVNELLSTYYSLLEQGKKPARIKRRLAGFYNQKLLDAREMNVAQGKPVPSEMEFALDYLDMALKRWLVGEKPSEETTDVEIYPSKEIPPIVEQSEASEAADLVELEEKLGGPTREPESGEPTLEESEAGAPESGKQERKAVEPDTSDRAAPEPNAPEAETFEPPENPPAEGE